MTANNVRSAVFYAITSPPVGEIFNGTIPKFAQTSFSAGTTHQRTVWQCKTPDILLGHMLGLNSKTVKVMTLKR